MTLDIYTDAGGCSYRKIRIGAIVVDQDDPDYKGYKFSKKTNIDTVKRMLGFKDEVFRSNSTIAEMYSILESLKEVSKLNIGVDSINIYTDSMISYNMCNGIQKKFRCKLLKKISESINSVKVKSGIDINFMWIKSHSGTWGNEQADILCKASQIEVNELCQILTK